MEKKNIPTIILPKEKAGLFFDWYIKDIAVEKEIPKIYTEGFFDVDISQYIHVKTPPILTMNAKNYADYKKLEDEIQKTYGNIVLHFKFINDDLIEVKSYSKMKKQKLSTYKIEAEKLKTLSIFFSTRYAITNNNDIVFDITNYYGLSPIGKKEQIQNKVNIFESSVQALCEALFISSLWYLATIKDTKAENKIKTIEKSDNIIAITPKTGKKNNIRNITTPLYNLGFVADNAVEKMIARKNGWKISCNFSVRGHYRHYKNGKVVFIKQYEKGKGLAEKTTRIKLSPNIV